MSEKSSPDKGYIRRRAAGFIGSLFRYIVLFGLGFVIIYPLLYMISCSFREPGDMSDPTVIWIPRHYTLSVIQETIKAMDLRTTLKNTLIMNVGCAFVQVLSCAVTGYGFARFSFKGKGLLFGVVIMMILVPPQVIALPLYTQFRYFGFGDHTVNLIDSMLTMYLPAMTGNGIRSGLMILIFRQFFKGLPRELEDAAYIDGCGPFMTFVRIMMPNAASAFLTVFLFSVVFYWNDHYVSSTFFTSRQTLSLMLENLDSQLFGSSAAELSPREKIVWKEAGCLLSISPMLIMYVFLQKYFTEGIERSGLVG